MGYLAIFFCIIIFIYTYARYKYFYHPVVFFTGLWSVILVLANMKLFGIYTASEKTYTIILLGCISFVIGNYIGEKYKITIGKSSQKQKKIFLEHKLRGKYIKDLVKILCFVTIAVYTIKIIQIIPLYLSGKTLQDIRAIYASNSINFGLGGPLFSILSSYVASPFALAIIPISAIEAFTPSRKRYFLVFICIYLQICNILIEAGRARIVHWLLIYILVYLIVVPYEKRRKISIKSKMRIIIAIAFCIIIVGVLTRMRGVNDQIKGIYIYIAGCVPFFNLQKDMLDCSDFYAYGFASLFGITTIIHWIFSVFGINFIFLEKVAELASRQDYYFIGDGINFNAFVTTFYHFYIDGRIFGVVLGMALYGYFCGKLYKNVCKRSSARDICVFSLVIIGLMMTMVRFWMVTTTYVLAVVYIYIIYFRIKK